MLMLIDTPDPRYRPDGEDEPGRERRWRPNPRVWTPFVGCVVCLVLAGMVAPLPSFVLAMVALGLFMDGATALLPPGDGLRKYRQ